MPKTYPSAAAAAKVAEREYATPANRRMNTPEYREAIGRAALGYVHRANGDYEAALDMCLAFNAIQSHSTARQDIATLLRRRADTVKGLHHA